MDLSLVLSLVILVVNSILMAVFYSRLRSAFSPKKILDALKSEVDSLVADLGREADRDVAILEHRIKSLRSLIDEADKRILLSSRESTVRKKEQEVLESLSKDEESTIRKSKVPDSPQAPVKTYAKESFVRRVNPIQPAIPVHEKVLDMARKGLSAEFIASSLSIPLGEVELIIDINSSSL